MNIKKYLKSFLFVITAIAASFVLAGSVFAQSAPGNDNAPQGLHGGWLRGARAGGEKPGVFGKVVSVSGNTITVTDSRTNVSYSVDASNAAVTKNGSASTLSAISVGDIVSVQGAVSGASVTATSIRDGAMAFGAGLRGNARGILGAVVSINGTTITITSKKNNDGNGSGSAVTYTVDASKAVVTKDGVASGISGIAAGDTIMVQGAISGNNIAATAIRDGVYRPNGGQNPIISGNGQPVVGGAVTAINGNTLTITNKSNVTYTVDVSSAKITKTGLASSTVSNISAGDNVVIQGAVNGNSVTASSVIDNGAVTAASGQNESQKPHLGFFAAIGNFFAHLFGF